MRLAYNIIFLTLFVVVMGCHSSSQKQRGNQNEIMPKEISMQKQIEGQDSGFIQGPLIFPTEQLLDWLILQGGAVGVNRKKIRLPVVIELDSTYRHIISRAYIGFEVAPSQKNQILLDIDDSGMGMPLLPQLRDLCLHEMPKCVVWIEGYWGKLLSEEVSDEAVVIDKSKKWPFAVLKCSPFHDEDLENYGSPRAYVEDKK
jgi:hypothetical protein